LEDSEEDVEVEEDSKEEELTVEADSDCEYEDSKDEPPTAFFGLPTPLDVCSRPLFFSLVSRNFRRPIATRKKAHTQ
jgi:hypothetical protein